MHETTKEYFRKDLEDRRKGFLSDHFWSSLSAGLGCIVSAYCLDFINDLGFYDLCAAAYQQVARINPDAIAQIYETLPEITSGDLGFSGGLAAQVTSISVFFLSSWLFKREAEKKSKAFDLYDIQMRMIDEQ